MHEIPKIFDDFLAYDLIPEEKRALIEQHLIEQNVTLNQHSIILSMLHRAPINNYLKSLMQATHKYAGLFISRAGMRRRP